MNEYSIESSSFRDPSGILFIYNRELFRQINISYKEEYDYLMESGLYRELVNLDFLIPHKEVNIPPIDKNKSYKIIKPIQIPFISYPYEWCFSQLKHAALVTLKIQKVAMKYGMILKEDKSEESKKNHLTYYKSLTKLISDFQEEKNQVTDPTIKNHLDERIDAVERDRKRIREMFPDITKEEWDVNTN